LAAMEAGHGSVNVHYQQRGPTKGKLGRYFAELKTLGTSLQGMPREIRHTLAKDTMDDIDFRSCHLTFLRHLCTLHSIPCQQLNHVISNRDICHNDLIAHGIDNPKVEILSVMNGGKTQVGGPVWWQEFQSEMTVCREKFVNMPQFKTLAEYCKSKKDYNVEGSLINLILFWKMIGRLLKKCMAIYQTFVNMMNSRVRKQLAFVFKHISNIRGRDQFFRFRSLCHDDFSWHTSKWF
jgi:hypothetical protein